MVCIKHFLIFFVYEEISLKKRSVMLYPYYCELVNLNWLSGFSNYTSFGWRKFFPESSIWNTVVPLLSYSCMFQVEICSQELEICKSVCRFIALAIVVETEISLKKRSVMLYPYYCELVNLNWLSGFSNIALFSVVNLDPIYAKFMCQFNVVISICMYI
jgi:hypothetical protein